MVFPVGYPSKSSWRAFIVFCCMSLSCVVSAECQLCSSYVPEQFQAVQDSVIQVWTALDVLRSITIAPADRARFVYDLLDGMLVILTDLNQLSSSCMYCVEYCSSRKVDIVCLDELLAYLADSFRAVFFSLETGEEKALQVVLLKIMIQMDAFKKRFSIKSQSLFAGQKLSYE